ncbi:MAG: hypothetical protein RL266_2337 [Bacteroidota bacterium]|jgi:hypothetical protein
MIEPYLSIVIVGRNDNYGGDFTDRFQNCINWNTRWLEHFGVKTEVVFVNWNPVPDQPQIIDQIRWPSERKHVTYRIITVPAEVHEQFVDSDVRDTVPLFEFIAKNVGIRRAQGKYILCINADVLIHPDIIRFIAHQKLDEGTYYRADRWDYSGAEKIELNELHRAGFSVFMKGFQYQLVDSKFKKARYKGLKLLNGFRIGWNLWKFRHPKLCNFLKVPVIYNNGGYMAHCHASGDFVLMTSNNWIQLKGYPENTSISTHTDSVMTILSFAKLKEHVFEVPVFHQAHERRYGWDDISRNPKFSKAYEFFEHVANVVKNGGSTQEFLNSEGWGLENVQLEEQPK